MKITSPIAIKSVAILASWIIRSWIGSCNIRIVFADQNFKPAKDKRYIFGFWHENILPAVYSNCCKYVATLVSRHRDGELIAQIIKLFHGKTFRGSTTRGGASALRQMMQSKDTINLAITPDGPKGPRRYIQNGAIYLAAKTQMPLVPIAYSSSREWRAGSWDKMLLPKPFSKIYGVCGKALTVPENLDRDDIEKYRKKFQQAMHETQILADQLAQKIIHRDDTFSPKEFNLLWI